MHVLESTDFGRELFESLWREACFTHALSSVFYAHSISQQEERVWYGQATSLPHLKT